jgi:hypothetical protein
VAFLLLQLNFREDLTVRRHGISSLLLLSLLVGGSATLLAQAAATTPPPPKVLVVTREFLKPGKGGSPHEKTESAFVQAMAAAKWPTRYLGTDALSGANRSVFFTGYDSFDAWGKDTAATFGNPTLSAALDRAFIADGELLTGIETNVFSYREDLSYSPAVDIGQMRYFEAISIKTKPGHEMEWEAIAKMYVENFPKAEPNAHWAIYQQMFGARSGGVYVVLIPHKSLSEVDAGMADGKKFFEQLGESGAKKLMDMASASTEAEESNLLMFNPKISYPPDPWVKSDPAFWKPKAAAAAKRAASQPTQ